MAFVFTIRKGRSNVESPVPPAFQRLNVTKAKTILLFPVYSFLTNPCSYRPVIIFAKSKMASLLKASNRPVNFPMEQLKFTPLTICTKLFFASAR